jgi:outer membrane receptor for ferric coprogen and ferric-rhodotorulic acid
MMKQSAVAFLPEDLVKVATWWTLPSEDVATGVGKDVRASSNTPTSSCVSLPRG